MSSRGQSQGDAPRFLQSTTAAAAMDQQIHFSPAGPPFPVVNAWMGDYMLGMESRSTFCRRSGFSRGAAHTCAREMQDLVLEDIEDVDLFAVECEEVNDKENTDDTRDTNKCQDVAASTNTESTSAFSSCNGLTSFPGGAAHTNVREMPQDLVLEDNRDVDYVAIDCEDTKDKENTEDPRDLLVTTVIMAVFKENGVADFWQGGHVVINAERLVKKTLEGLDVRQDYNPDIKDLKIICEAFIKDLEKTYGGKRELRSALLSEQPEVEASIVQHLQAIITEHSARSAESEVEEPRWREFMRRFLPRFIFSIILLILGIIFGG